MKDIAASLNVDRRTLQRWQKLGPDFQPAPRAKERPERRKLSAAMAQALQGYFEDNVTSTLQRAFEWLAATLNVTISARVVGKYCK